MQWRAAELRMAKARVPQAEVGIRLVAQRCAPLISLGLTMAGPARPEPRNQLLGPAFWRPLTQRIGV